jgi:galactonate dehydratase
MNVRGHYQGFMIDAMAGIDIACWDLSGRLQNEPVSGLLGGRRRDKLSAYVTNGTVEHLDRGFAGIKVPIHSRSELPLSEELREVSDPARIKIEHHWSFDYVHEALAVARHLESIGVGFIEAPLCPERISETRELQRRLDIPVAMGEELRTRHEFRWRTDKDTFSIGQPDINRTGLTEGRRISSHLDSCGIPVAPHLSASIGPGILATLHLASTLPNFHLQEFHPVMVERSERVLQQSVPITDGKLIVPSSPGLGIPVKEDAIRDTAVDRIELSR